jgi:MoxR-like ATPase
MDVSSTRPALPTGATEVPATLQAAIAQVGDVVLGKSHQVRLAFACLLARGHVLIEDLPGVGKTTLAHAIAYTLGLQFQRIQFTSDLLPADILGVSIYEREAGTFSFHPGPIFAQVILADEINRATPKSQSALLEAMEEHQVTVEGESRPLPEPFFVLATQNPSDQAGTFVLPESQLDRFLMRLELGFPDPDSERALLQGRDRRDLLAELSPVMTPQELLALQRRVPELHVSEALIDYLQALLAETRKIGRYVTGLSPRAGLALLRSAQAWALLDGRDYVLPEDVQTVLPPIVGHRLRLADEQPTGATQLAEQLLHDVPIP